MKIRLAMTIAALSGCSPVMEANRPDPVDISQFVTGQSRISVLATLGSPMASTTENGMNCDIYKLYTKGPGSTGRGAIVAGEVVADIFTLGLAEVILTPTEAATRSSKHAVIACYTSENKLASINESDTKVD